MYYDTQIIYKTEDANENKFTFDECFYYKTPTGRTKRQDKNGKLESISKELYQETWRKVQIHFRQLKLTISKSQNQF